MNEKKIVSVIGGTGFIGKYLVDLLLNKDYYVKIISRNSKSKKIFLPSSKLGQFSLLDCNIVDKKRLSNCIKGSKYVINLVGLLEPKGENTFKNAHCLGAKNLTNLCKEQNICLYFRRKLAVFLREVVHGILHQTLSQELDWKNLLILKRSIRRQLCNAFSW